MKYTILLDSSNTQLAVGIANETQVLSYVMYEAWQSQSEHMIPELDKLLKEVNASRDDIDRVIVSVGPGSYTGVRIAITIAKVMATAIGCDVYPISSLLAQKDSKSPSICLINARSGRSYFGVYEFDKVLENDKILTNEEVLDYIKNHPDYIVCGNTNYLGIEGYQANLCEEMFSLRNSLKKIDNPMALKPVYMKD